MQQLNEGMPVRDTTRRKYYHIHQRYKALLGTDTVMHIYYKLADEFDMSVERIRQIIALKRKNRWQK